MSQLVEPNEDSTLMLRKVPEVDSIKLFMGKIPTFMREAELREMLADFGQIYELKLLRDRNTGESRGCCFVTFYDKQSALSAQSALHNRKIMPTMSEPVQVRPADEDRGERKLFVGMISKKLDEQGVKMLFGSFGLIEDCVILRDEMGRSRGCAFVTFESKQSALNAIKGMHRSQLMENCSAPINVRFADSYQTRKVRSRTRRELDNLLSAELAPSHGLNNLSVYQKLLHNLNNPSQFKQHLVGAFGDSNQSMTAAGDIEQSDFDDIQHKFKNIKPIVGPENSNLFIYHLPAEFDDFDLAQLFSVFGAVLSSRVFIDKMTHTSKCFGFVSYDNPYSAHNAIKALDGFKIRNKRLKVQLKQNLQPASSPCN